MALSLTGETITSLMHRLDSENNLNLFYLVNYLSRYYSSITFQSQKDYQLLMDCYGNVIKQITSDYYEKQVDNAPKEFRSEYTEKFHEYTQMINNFNKLPSREQKNIFNLGWFILDCQNPNLDSPEKDNLWRDYSNLIEQIKSLPINEQR